MRATFLILLLFFARHLQAADVQTTSWVSGSLVEVLADSSVKELDESGGTLTVGFPAFQKLSIRKGEGENIWIVSGMVCSTNTGLAVQEKAIYAGYEGGHFRLVAMSNLKGEVLFSVSPMLDSNSKSVAPTHLYVGSNPVTAPSLKGLAVRKYLLRAAE